MKIEQAGRKKSAFELVIGILITSVAFCVLPLLTFVLPHNMFIVSLIGLTCTLNLGVMIYLALSAPSDWWRALQFVLCMIAGVVAFHMGLYETIIN